MPINKRLKAFTILELLVSMTLTGILVAFAFMGYNQMQKLFIDYNSQSNFISEYNQFQTVLANISQQASAIEHQDDKTLVFKTDSSSIQVILEDKATLLKLKQSTDTFHFSITKPEFVFENNAAVSARPLIRQFQGSVLFRSQKFTVSFRKQYDAESTLKHALDINPPDEFN